MTNSHSTSKIASIKELPCFIYESGSGREVLRVPSQYQPSPIVMDTANLQMLMSTSLKVSLTLAKILKAKLELWQEVTTCLNKIGILIAEVEPMNKEERA